MDRDEFVSCRYIGEKKYLEKEKHGLADLEEIVEILRTHCPWDREQSVESLKTTVRDEALEVIGAIDQDDADNLCEELGDLLFQIVFMSCIASEKGLFDLDDVVQGISDKMIRRHPHVFGDIEVKSREEIHALWKEVKAAEKAEKACRTKRSIQS